MKHSAQISHPSSLEASSKRNKIIALAAALTVVIIGYILIFSKAASSFVSVNPSTASLSGNASVTTTSDGTKALSFNAPPPPTTPPPTTPPPASSLKGWQLTPTSVGLAPFGLSCDSLPEYSGPISNGHFKPAAGAVISQKRISRSMNLSNGNITIEKSCLKGDKIINGPQGMVVTWDPDQCGSSCSPGRGPVTIRDSEFNGLNMTSRAVSAGCGFHGIAFLERNYVHDMGSGLCFVNTGSQYSGSMINNYIHKLRGWGDPESGGSHNEAATIRDFPTNVNPNRKIEIFNNYMDSKVYKDADDPTRNMSNETGGLFIQTIYGEIDNVNIEGNLFTGNAYNIGLEVHDESKDKFGRNMKANNNRFFGWAWQNPGYVYTGGIVSYGWAESRDNYKNDPTKPDNRGAAVNISGPR